MNFKEILIEVDASKVIGEIPVMIKIKDKIYYPLDFRFDKDNECFILEIKEED